jgi:hypothetical protein
MKRWPGEVQNPNVVLVPDPARVVSLVLVSWGEKPWVGPSPPIFFGSRRQNETAPDSGQAAHPGAVEFKTVLSIRNGLALWHQTHLPFP